MPRRARSLARERDRFVRAIGLIVMSAAPAGAVSAACSSSSDSPATNDDASIDVNAADVLADDSSKTNDVANGNDVSCIMTSTPFDSGNYYDADAESGVIDLSCTYQLPCGLTPTLVAVGCEIFLAGPEASVDAYIPVSCSVPEGLGCTDGSLTPGPNGALSMTCLDCFGGGRRPRGARRARVEASDAFGSYLATMARDEALSVDAFARLEEELAQFGAPRHLRAAAAKARREEIEHARIMTGLASARGASASQPKSRVLCNRSLEAMAIENAVEGCVKETFGAVMLAWQARHAVDPTLREAFAAIAHDEAEHAALSWTVANWAEKQLDSRANRRVQRARDRAARALMLAIAETTTVTFSQQAGLPNASARRALWARTVAILSLDTTPASPT